MKIPLTRLLYTVKMIYNISAFFNNSVRVASYLVKITFQAIISAKKYITVNGSMTIWNQPIELVEKKIQECIDLNANYKAAYHKIKNMEMKNVITYLPNGSWLRVFRQSCNLLRVFSIIQLSSLV